MPQERRCFFALPKSAPEADFQAFPDDLSPLPEALKRESDTRCRAAAPGFGPDVALLSNEKERVMGHRPFKAPVRLRLDKMGDYVATSAWDALEYLQKHWSRTRDANYHKALRACRDAVDGWVTADRAREAVVRAAQSAGLLKKT
jgi:hypothetical protein